MLIPVIFDPIFFRALHSILTSEGFKGAHDFLSHACDPHFKIPEKHFPIYIKYAIKRYHKVG